MNMKEMTQKTGLSADSIRYYEKEKLIRIPRNISGYRDFTTANLERLTLITKFRAAGCGIDFLRKYCALLDDTKNHDSEQRQMLADEAINAKKRLAAMTDAIDYLDYKVEVYYKNVKKLGDQSKN
ncbi:MerR family transcriptional regulator [Lactococcus termiticola]|uniref:MerR family transcriptional regulator n=1 Tax=Lactococcus termiticola TaxID=2169526 RepID=A0A2R5HHT5_9LACT|nr:MerR family transcriptional regulator [Lactococcus termiticola]GBG97562.1 MerR family transcriptional regulator [Lactococcus termiticola]